MRAPLEVPRVKLFLLSPALMTGVRAEQLLSTRATFAAARLLRSPQGVAIGEAFSFMSGLYFRGKMAYAKQFGAPPREWPESGAYVIAPGFGLVPPDWALTLSRMKALQRTPVDPKRQEYRRPLERDAEALAERIGRLDCQVSVILLGSVASGKYVDLLWPIFQERLLYPESFTNVGDMSRGALMLRAVRSGQELEYIPVERLLFRRNRRIEVQEA
jgi:hypothetical protein